MIIPRSVAPMMPFRKPLLGIFKTIMANSMYLVPPQRGKVEQGPGDGDR
jgi:hypothetical protein